MSRRAIAICVVLLAACALGELLRMAGVPVAYLFGGMAVGLAAALSPAVDLGLPRNLYAAAQALLGAAIGSLAQAGISGSPSILAALPLLVVATILLSLGAGSILSRRAAVGHDTTLIQARGHRHVVPDPPSAGDSAAILASLLAVAGAGLWLGGRVHVPAPALAGPLLSSGPFWAGSVCFPTWRRPRAVTTVALAIIGLEIGLRLDRAAVRALRRMAPIISGLTAAMMAGCAGLAVLLSVLTSVPPVDACLMMTRGGINAVLAAAVSLKGVDLALVTLAQTLRLLAMVIVAPRLIRWMGGATPGLRSAP